MFEFLYVMCGIGLFIGGFVYGRWDTRKNREVLKELVIQPAPMAAPKPVHEPALVTPATNAQRKVNDTRDAAEAQRMNSLIQGFPEA